MPVVLSWISQKTHGLLYQPNSDADIKVHHKSLNALADTCLSAISESAVVASQCNMKAQSKS